MEKEETLCDRLMEAILDYWGIDGVTAVEYFGDTSIRMEFTEGDSFIITVEEE